MQQQPRIVKSTARLVLLAENDGSPSAMPQMICQPEYCEVYSGEAAEIIGCAGGSGCPAHRQLGTPR